jgi:hypothetical protein
MERQLRSKSLKAKRLVLALRKWQSLAFGKMAVCIRYSIRNTATREGTRRRYRGKLLHEGLGLFD